MDKRRKQIFYRFAAFILRANTTLWREAVPKPSKRMKVRRKRTVCSDICSSEYIYTSPRLLYIPKLRTPLVYIKGSTYSLSLSLFLFPFHFSRGLCRYSESPKGGIRGRGQTNGYVAVGILVEWTGRSLKAAGAAHAALSLSIDVESSLQLFPSCPFSPFSTSLLLILLASLFRSRV